MFTNVLRREKKLAPHTSIRGIDVCIAKNATSSDTTIDGMRSKHRSRPLSSALDKEVFQVIRTIIDRDEDDDPTKLTTTGLYNHIRNSNSSLNRRPKKLLEDSIERVIESIKGDQDVEDDSEEILDVPGARDEQQMNARTSNGLNKSIVGAWTSNNKNNADPPRSGTATPNTKRERQANGEPVAKKRKTEKIDKSIDRSPPTNVSLADMGGTAEIANKLLDMLILPLKDPQFLIESNMQTTRGILLHGPPGCGKTMLANALAAALKVNFIPIAAPSIVSGMSGESEKALRELFEEAKRCAPCLMFIDEIDAITPKRESAQREMEKRIVAQLLSCLDDIDPATNDGKAVVVLAATNRPDSIDPALRRGGRFDKEIIMPVPNERVREKILRALTRKSNLNDDVDFPLLAQKTPGCVGADLRDLVSTTDAVAQKRYLESLREAAEQLDFSEPPTTNDKPESMDVDVDLHPHQSQPQTKLDEQEALLASNLKIIKYFDSNPDQTNHPKPTNTITMTDFLTALPQIQPSALREGFATIPTTTFSQIGALKHHRRALSQKLIQPILQPKLYTSIGLNLTSGILLWGPPGNGKTLLAKAVANSSHANFISVKGPELLNKYVGESERSVRTLFTRARSSVPVIIFFDELDALVPRRDGGNSEASSRVVNTLLTELDGVGASREGIYIIGATNRPDIIDPAMLRPGRLETLLYVGIPSEEDRVDILRTLTKKIRGFTWSDEMEGIARSCTRFSGADLQSLVTQAGFAAIARMTPSEGDGDGMVVKAADGEVRVTLEDFVTARASVQPSVSAEEHARFLAQEKEWGQTDLR